ncbi:MAG: ABC transporter permease [Planctomycetota bacterium]|jgi:simple sugar transport system permease protein|nr:ABC transporter permease [Planctomycetota bacterium]
MAGNSILKHREAVLAALVVVLALGTSLINPNFLTLENITDLLKANTVSGIFSLGVLMVIVSGGFDVSFTAIAQVTQYAIVLLMLERTEGNIYLAILAAVFFGIVLGLINGAIIHYYNMPAIIVTIATQSLYYGIMYVVTRGRQINDIPSFFWSFSNAKVVEFTSPAGGTYGLSLITALWFILAVILYVFLRHSKLGRSIYAVGGSRISAERIGFNLAHTTLFVYAAMGALAGLAGVVHVSIVQSVIPSSIVGSELQVIAAVVLGGASVTGGKGTVLGAFLGVLLLAILSNSLTLLRISSYYSNVFTGLIILISVTANAIQVQRQRRQRVRVQIDKA